MSVFYAPIAQAVSDKAVTKPIPNVSIPNPFAPVNWGPRWAESSNYRDDQNAPHLELFYPPVFQPSAPFQSLNNQATGNVVEQCPVTTIHLRNHFETYNVNKGKIYGGYDSYNVQSIPSCVERAGAYMNFLDFTKPWNRVIADGGGKEQDLWAVDSHSGDWAQPTPRWLESLEKGTPWP